MIHRALLHIAGPSGSGKTMLIEALLRSLDEDVTCVRAIQDETLRRPKESRPRSHAGLRRDTSADAGTVVVYCFPSAFAEFVAPALPKGSTARDPGLRKALTRMRRAIRSAG